MVAAERYEMADGCGLRLDLFEAAQDVAVGDAKIADIGKVERRRLAPGGRMIAVASMRLAWRIAAGPNRAPGRFEVPRS